MKDFPPWSKKIARINDFRAELADCSMTDNRVKLLNTLLLKLSRCLTWVLYTYTDRFEQNSYAYTPAARAIPMLAAAVDLAAMAPDSLEYHLNLTEAMRNRNRVAQAVNDANEFAELYLSLIDSAN